MTQNPQDPGASGAEGQSYEPPSYGQPTPASQSSAPDAGQANPWTPQSGSEPPAYQPQSAGEQPSYQQSAGEQPYQQPSYQQSAGEQPYQQSYGTDQAYGQQSYDAGQQQYGQDQSYGSSYGGDQGYGQQQTYGAPAQQSYGTPAPYQPAGFAPDHPDSTTVLVLGIISLVVCGVTGPFALVKGNAARKEMAANPGRYGASTSLTVGWVMGIIGTVYLALAVLYLIFVIVMVIIGAASGF